MSEVKILSDAPQPDGYFPTPYGVSVPCFKHPTEELYLFDGEAAAICAGIFDKAERQRFIEDSKATGSVLLHRAHLYGGYCPLLKVPLPRPDGSVYPAIQNAGAKALRLDVKIEAFVTLAMDCDRWCDRADGLLEAIKVNLDQPEGHPVEEMAMTLALQLILTAAFEHLAESKIDCIEAAALYALSEHKEWRRAGLAWLKPVRKTWFRTWVDARPTYRSFASRCRRDNQGLPFWIVGEV